MRKKRIIFILILFLGLCSIPIIHASIYTSAKHSAIVNPENDSIVVQIGFVGDIMAHMAQLNAQKLEDGTYDFNNNYKWMAPYFQKNDLMIGNIETTFAGEEQGYSTYPIFNTPDALLDALKNSGFDILSTANNHMYDQGSLGLFRTIQILKSKNILFTGSRENVEDSRYLIRSVKGIKIGFLAYTYETTGDDSIGVTINGLKIKKVDVPFINSFNPSNIEETVLEWKAEIKKIKQEGAQIIVMILHWGNEYQTTPCHYQLALADSLNKMGVDIIFGSHPHVVQPIDFIVDNTNNHVTYVSYSSGNFISNQRYETLENYNTEDGLYTEIQLLKTPNSPVQIYKINPVPLWVNRYSSGEKFKYEVIPLPQIMKNQTVDSTFTPEQMTRMGQSYLRTNSTITKNYNSIFDLYIKN